MTYEHSDDSVRNTTNRDLYKSQVSQKMRNRIHLIEIHMVSVIFIVKSPGSSYTLGINTRSS